MEGVSGLPYVINNNIEWENLDRRAEGIEKGEENIALLPYHWISGLPKER